MEIIIGYAVVSILGLLIGSFLNVCIYRIPNEESIVRPPSHCMNCGTRLTPLDLVPVFSFLFLRGKCRHCGVKISARYPMIELLTALIYVTLFSKYGPSVEFIASVFLMSILIAVFFIDYDHKIIPDGLVITGLIGGAGVIVYNLFHSYGIIYAGDRSWWNPVLGMFTGSGFLFMVSIVGSIIYKTEEAIGGGDIKIFAPIGIFLGWQLTIVALFISVIVGGFVSLGLILMNMKDRKGIIPFGPFIVIGTFITIMWGSQILSWYLSRL